MKGWPELLPELLPPNLMEHQYRGGARIGRLRGLVGVSDNQPEEWLGSITTMFHDSNRGRALTADGQALGDLVAAAPRVWLGDDFPNSADVLFKLLDAGQRLPVHAHPDREFAAQHLHSAHGKSEAWLILEAEPGAAVHLGWRQAIDLEEFAAKRDIQDSEWMLSRMHRIEVRPGDAVYVPAGQVHAIDAGLLIAEIQEPSDFSIVVEWSATTLTRENSELGLTWGTASTAITLDPLSDEVLKQLITHNDLGFTRAGVTELLVSSAAEFFTLRHVAAHTGESSGRVPAGFGVLLVLDGDGILRGRAGELAVTKGNVLAVPHEFGDWELVGAASALIASGSFAKEKK